MSKRLRYQVAVSLDGFIAGSDGEYDWIVADPSIDFNALYKQFDTVVMGRKTYEVVLTQGNGAMPGMDVVVFSKTLPPTNVPGVRIVSDDAVAVVRDLKNQTGRDIWLFGGGRLFRSLLDAALVDSVEVAVMPVILGSGIPLVQPGGSTKLRLADYKILPASGIAVLSYAVTGAQSAVPTIEYVKEKRIGGVASGSSQPKERKRSSTKRTER